MDRAPLAPAAFPEIPPIAGVRFATVAAGVRYKGRTDLMLAMADPGSSVAGVFTRSATRAAPVLDCQTKIGSAVDGPAAFLVNSGNANAFTGARGQEAVDTICAALSEVAGLPADRVFTSSTGVIGEPLPHDRITAKLSELVDRLDASGIEAAAEAIRTTDTCAKGSVRSVEIGGKTVTIAGIAKGSGMIAPDMATMLAYIFTDAKIDQAALQGLLSAQVQTTFNAITVDSDTSTSDSVLVCATGASGVDVSDSVGFETALHEVLLDLAHQIVRDGEGATKFVEIRVTGAVSDADARTVGMAIANSPLVKTAIAGEDPNWGRIVMAIGKSGAQADRDRISIRFGDVVVAEKGWVSPDYIEADAAKVMQGDEIPINVDLGIGGGNATVWTCDLTHAYIDINADYRS